MRHTVNASGLRTENRVTEAAFKASLNPRDSDGLNRAQIAWGQANPAPTQPALDHRSPVGLAIRASARILTCRGGDDAHQVWPRDLGAAVTDRNDDEPGSALDRTLPKIIRDAAEVIFTLRLPRETFHLQARLE
jgi:hypothetical protein